ncbi:MAG: hypothetical protein LUF33_08340 [Clostridiales bacterium]|nr:hypothetical protein [Clostridiales bacterium]
MDYIAWSNEYMDTAGSISTAIKRLINRKGSADELGKKELDMKIAKYKLYYNECISVANHLKARAEGVE